MSERLFISCFGEPRGHYCWGHIYEELARRDRILGCVDTHRYQTTTTLKLADRLITRFSKRYYRRAHFDFKGKWHRTIRAWNSQRLARRLRARSHLHITTLDMPGFKREGVREYLIIDSTWNSWQRYFSNNAGYSDGLMADIDSLDKRSFDQADHIFTLGRYVCDDLEKYYGVPKSKVTAIGSGAGDIEPFHGEKNYAAGKILFVAKTRFESKGGPLLLRAFQIAREKCPWISLIIVGSDEALRFFGDLEGVTILPFASQSELQRIFEECSVFAMPAINEPWGMVFLEAMISRMPIVGLHRNALPEMTLGGRFGFLAERPDPELVAKKIIEAVSDPRTMALAGEDGQAHVISYYSWEKTVDRMLAVIDERNAS